MTKMTKTTDLIAGTVTFTFASGDVIIAAIEDYPETIQRKALHHGFSQKIGDECSGVKDAGEAYAKCKVLNDNLLKGSWGSSGSGGKLAKALQMVSGETMTDCIKALAKMNDKTKAALRKTPSILDAMATIAAKEAEGTTGMDIGALFE